MEFVIIKEVNDLVHWTLIADFAVLLPHMSVVYLRIYISIKSNKRRQIELVECACQLPNRH